MQGRAYIFLRQNGAPLPLGCSGHVGWAFLADEEQRALVCGSTENFDGDPVIPPGEENGSWVQSFSQITQMLQVMQLRGYDVFKVAQVNDPHPHAAELAARNTREAGYKVKGNNCLDHAVKVLDAYGVKDLPFSSMHPSPNEWFSLFQGDYHKI